VAQRLWARRAERGSEVRGMGEYGAGEERGQEVRGSAQRYAVRGVTILEYGGDP
jgi:hypothetical protein